MTLPQSEQSSLLLPIYQNFSREPDQFLIQITKVYNDFATFINNRQTGTFNLSETVAGQFFFNPVVSNTAPANPRPAYRKVFSIGAINAGATSVTAHGISNITSFTFINGVAIVSGPIFRPIPYASVTAVNQQIEINVDSTNINISNGAAAPNITSAIIVLEYLKN